MKSGSVLLDFNFLFVDDTAVLNLEPSKKIKLQEYTKKLFSLIEKYNGKSAFCDASKLSEQVTQLNIAPFEDLIIVGAGGLNTEKLLENRLKYNNRLYVPLTRRFGFDPKKQFTYFDSENNLPFEDSPYKNLLSGLNKNILFLDDWIATGESLHFLLSLTSNLANTQKSALSLISTLEKSSPYISNDGIIGFNEVYSLLSAIKTDDSKVRGYTSEALFKKSLLEEGYMDQFIAKRLSGDAEGKQVISECINLLRSTYTPKS